MVGRAVKVRDCGPGIVRRSKVLKPDVWAGFERVRASS